MEPPTTPHITRHGTKARSTGAITINAGLCITNAKYVALTEATENIDNIVIFFLMLILELHDIIFYINIYSNEIYQTIAYEFFFNCKLTY